MKLYKSRIRLLTAVMFYVLLNGLSYAETRIAILDFELSDFTSLPNIPREIERTTGIRPMLIRNLEQRGDYKILTVKNSKASMGEPITGYWFDHDDEAAKLGERLGVDWIVIGRHSKPSFLFSYLMAHLIRVETRRLQGDYAVELKGNHQNVMIRGVNEIAKKIHRTIRVVNE